MIKECIYCKKEYKKNPKYSKAQWKKSKYCSLKCAKKDIKVTPEMVERLRKIATGIKQSEETKIKRGLYKTGEEHYLWKGGVTKDDNGYLRNNKSKERVHRAIMEKHIGRKLHYNEIVHHINHNKLDNRIENLQIVSRAEHVRLHKPRLGTGSNIAKMWQEQFND